MKANELRKLSTEELTAKEKALKSCSTSASRWLPAR